MMFNRKKRCLHSDNHIGADKRENSGSDVSKKENIYPSSEYDIDFNTQSYENGLDINNVSSQKTHLSVKKIIFAVIACLLAVTVTLGGMHYRNVKSNKNFTLAKSHEEKNEYEAAIHYYSLVIPDDSDNYSIATEKLEELKRKIGYIKNCAKAVVAANINSMFSENNITDIYYAEKGSAYASSYGEGTVAIIAPVMSTDCTFLVVPKTDAGLDYSNYPCSYNHEFSVYVYGIGTENYTKGWLKGGWDTVTDTYVTMAKHYGVRADKEKVLNYVEEYYSKKDKSVFE